MLWSSPGESMIHSFFTLLRFMNRTETPDKLRQNLTTFILVGSRMLDYFRGICQRTEKDKSNQTKINIFSLVYRVFYASLRGNFIHYGRIKSRRIRQIKMKMIHAETLRQMIAQRRNAITFGRMVTRCKKMEPQFTRDMHGVFGHLAGDIGIQPLRGRHIKMLQRRAGTPTHAPYRAFSTGYKQRHTPQRTLDETRAILRRQRNSQLAVHRKRRIATEASLHRPTQYARKLRVIAVNLVRIERQVIREQIDVVREQRCNARAFHADDAWIFATPELPVMHVQCIRARPHRRFDERATRGDAAHHSTHNLGALDLQTVGRVIVIASHIQ